MERATTVPLPLGHLRLHQYLALQPGPRLLVTAAVHGNESCGTRALSNIVQALDAGTLCLQRGQLSLLPVTNPLAYAHGQRQGERNLNRRLVPHAEPACYEDRVAGLLCPLLAAHEVLLDLHSFEAPGEPFVMLGPRNNTGPLEPFAHELAETRLARALGAPRIVEGWLAAHARGLARQEGTALASGQDVGQAVDQAIGTTEAMRRAGGYGVTVECGQHRDPAAVAFAEAALRRALALLGMIAPADAAPPPAEAPECLQMQEVVHRLHAQDRFEQAWRNFDRVHAGQCVAWRHDGSAVRAPADGWLVFPDDNAAAGSDWFYWAGPSDRGRSCPVSVS